MSNLAAAFNNTLDLSTLDIAALEDVLDAVNVFGWDLSYLRDEDEGGAEYASSMIPLVHAAIARIKAELDDRALRSVAVSASEDSNAPSVTSLPRNSHMHTLSPKDVAIIAATAKSNRQRTRAEAYTLIKACDLRLKQAAANQLCLAEGVRLPLTAVIRLLWTIRKIALVQWKLARAAAAPVAYNPADEAAKAAEYDAAFAYDESEPLFV